MQVGCLCLGVYKLVKSWQTGFRRDYSEGNVPDPTTTVSLPLLFSSSFDMGIRFREMCEDSTPTKALLFLQTQVSPVVNHDDQRETEDYRSLMTFLLAPKASTASLIPRLLPTSVFISNVPSPMSDSGSTESVTDGWTRMKSRETTPIDGNWTSDMMEAEDEDDNESFSRPSYPKLSAELLRSDEDALEKRQREGGKGTAMQADRYAQRTEVFESLLEFVNEWDKEPSGSLLDFVTRNDCKEDDL